MNDAVTHWDGPGLDAWRPWTPREVARALEGLPIPWCIVGGWAIELALGHAHRAHEDMEIAISRPQFPAIRDHLSSYRLHAVGDGEVRALPEGALTPPEKHQNWVLDPTDDAWRMDIMLEPGDETTWVFRRDERIQRPRAAMISLRDGVPYLKPAGVLLYKAKARRTKDEIDFDACLPLLDAPEREWLRDALRVAHPGHPWIERL